MTVAVLPKPRHTEILGVQVSYAYGNGRVIPVDDMIFIRDRMEAGFDHGSLIYLDRHKEEVSGFWSVGSHLSRKRWE